MATSAELGLKLTDERQQHAAWLAGFKKDDGYDMTAEQVGEFNTRNKALETLQKEYDDALVVEKSAAENAAKLAPQGRIISGEGSEPSDGRIKTPEALDAAFKGFLKIGREHV